MTASAIRPLGIPTVPMQGESLVSLITRASQANVIPNVTDLLGLAGIVTKRPAYVPFSEHVQTVELAKCLGLPDSTVRMRIHSSWSTNGKNSPSQVSWFGTRLPRRFINAETFRFSPAGLRNAPFHRSQWMIRPLTYCPESMELLVSACPSCGGRLGWRGRRSLCFCEKCMHPLVNAPTMALDPDLHELARHIANLVSPDSAMRKQACSHLPAPMCDWEPGDIFSAIVELGAILPGDSSKQRGTAESGRFKLSNCSVEHLVRGYRFLLGWPTSLVGELEVRPSSRECQSYNRIRVFGRYFRHSATDTPLRDILRAEIPLAASRMDAPLRSPSGVRPVWDMNRNMISQSEAERELHISKHVLRRLPPTAKCVRIGANGVVTYERSLLDKSRRVFHEGVRAAECADVLGVPAWAMAALAERGLLARVVDTDAELLAAECLFERSSLGALDRKLTNRRIVEGVIGVPVERIMRHRFHPMDWADLISAIMLGDIGVAQQQEGRGHQIISMMLCISDAERLLGILPTREPPQGIPISCADSAKLLGTNEVAVGVAVRKGLLHAKKGKGNRLGIELCDVAAFDRAFFVSSQSRANFAVGGLVFGNRMRSAGYTPVAVIHKLTVWMRTDVDRVFPRTVREFSSW